MLTAWWLWVKIISSVFCFVVNLLNSQISCRTHQRIFLLCARPTQRPWHDFESIDETAASLNAAVSLAFDTVSVALS